MASYNLVVLMGNLTKDPELRYTSNNNAVCSFSLAVRKLNDIKKRKRVLLVVTDIEEIESPIRFRKAIDTAKESDVQLLGLGINTKSMQFYFDRFVELENLERFGEELLRLLRSVLI